KYACLTTPDESYHGVVYTDAFGLGGAYITKATAQLMRDLGSIPAPMNAFIVGTHLESLHLRIARHIANAQQVAEYLEANDKIAWVRYPGLKNDPYHALAEKYMPKGTCGVIAFGIKGDAAKAAEFTDNLKMIAIATHVADARSCILHPASTTHRQLNDEQLEAAGVKPELLRLSCGIEAAEDIIADIEQALAAV
ncbi:MAG: PLP-dependent transferase, partial [Coriobacteriales bacterium]|nr:PLP-dependent transferase [Coriobacteriales bacterium]